MPGLIEKLQRIQKTATQANAGRYFLYGQNGELLVETDQHGNILIEHLVLNQQPLGVFLPDEDQDGLTNQAEAAQGTLPTHTDSDSDGLTNIQEWFQYGTDSTNRDSDGDGVPDGAEVTAGRVP